MFPIVSIGKVQDRGPSVSGSFIWFLDCTHHLLLLLTPITDRRVLCRKTSLSKVAGMRAQEWGMCQLLLAPSQQNICSEQDGLSFWQRELGPPGLFFQRRHSCQSYDLGWVSAMLTSINVFSTQALASSEPTEPLQSNCLECTSGQDIIQTWYSSAHRIEPAPSNKDQQKPATSPAPSPTVLARAVLPPGRLPNLLSGQACLSLPATGHGLTCQSLCRPSAHVGRLRLTQFWHRAKPYAFTSVP